MVEMTPQDMQNFAKTMAEAQTGKADADEDDCENTSDLLNRPATGLSGDPRDRKPSYDLYKVDYKWVA